MRRFIVVAALAAGLASPSMADGLFMGQDWSAGTSQASAPPASRDPRPRSEDTEGVYAGKQMRPSVQAYGPHYAGRGVPDGVCDAYQTTSEWGGEGIMFREAQPTHYLYGGGNCAATYYPGFTFFGGQPNMALAPHWGGQPDFVPQGFFNYMDWMDPRYNPALRNGG